MTESEIDEIVEAYRKASRRSMVILFITSMIGAIGGLIGIAAFIFTVIMK